MVAAQNGPQLESKQWETGLFPSIVAPFKNNLVLSLKLKKVNRFFEGRMLHPYCNLTFAGPDVS